VSDDQFSSARQRIGDFAPTLASLTDDILFAQVWERPGLSKRDRSLVTVAALVALYRTNEMAAHMRTAVVRCRRWRRSSRRGTPGGGARSGRCDGACRQYRRDIGQQHHRPVTALRGEELEHVDRSDPRMVLWQRQ
jgi:hypothetical protein